MIITLDDIDLKGCSIINDNALDFTESSYFLIILFLPGPLKVEIYSFINGLPWV